MMLMAISGTAIRILTLNSTNLYKMKNIAIYIFTIICTVILASCSLEEMQSVDSSKDGAIEFIVRPTSFISHNAATKTTRAITPTQLTEAERKITSAYFLVFNSEGKRKICEKLTVSSNSIPSRTLLSDYGADNVTVCFIANVPESYIEKIQEIDDLSTEPLNLTYGGYADTGYIGIPIINGEYCFPMFGMASCSLKNADSQVVIDLKRLFAKVSVNINLNLTDSGEMGTEEAYFHLKSLVIKNIPNKVKLTEGKALDENNKEVLTESEWIYGEEHGIEVTCDNVVIYDDDYQNNGHKISFYVPEYILLPDPEKLKDTQGKTDEEKERMKPTLVKDATLPVSMTFKGDYYSVFGEQIDITYDILFGENNYDSFSLIRNVLYTNNITIKGASVIDNRVEMKYAGFVVGFPHSVKIDAHYNVRPLRLKFTDDFISGMEDGLYTHGEIKIEVQRGEGQSTSWIALERPIESEISGESVYAKGTSIKGAYPTKRKYFTTGLIKELDERVLSDGNDDPTAGSSVTFRTDDPKAMTGEVITWVYIDEYDSRSATASREATLTVTFTMDGSSEGVTKKYLVRQSAMYPMTIDGDSYGVELFEEYTMDYDTMDHYDYDDNGDYDGDDGDGSDDGNGDEPGFGDGVVSTVNGFPWGLKDIDLSRNKPALHVNDAKVEIGKNSSDELKEYLKTGIGDYDGITVVQTMVEQEMKSKLKDLDSYYDFYTSDDVGDGNLLGDLFGTNEARDYEGFIMNIEIIHTLLKEYKDDASAKLNGMILDEAPLSAIAYCYNKNKRNANGEVISVISEKELDISNYHWYAPAIKEIEDIIKNAYDGANWRHDEFKTFEKNMYWSCQPAYLNNDIGLDYEARTKWTINGTNWRGSVTSTKVLSGEILASGNGDYLQDDVNRARATKYDVKNNTIVNSGSAHKSKKMNIVGSFGSDHTYTTNVYLGDANKVASDLASAKYLAYTTQYFISLNTYLRSVNWDKSGITDGTNTPDRGEGNITRDTPNRVRCVYYPHNYTKATRNEASQLASAFGQKGYTTSLSR